MAKFKKMHRWIGLSAGLLLLFQALTGVAISFYHELDRLIAADLYRSAGTVALTPAELLAAAERHFPDMHVTSLPLDTRDGDNAVIDMRHRDDPDAIHLVYVDPSDGSLAGTRVFGAFCPAAKCVVPFLYKLHAEFALGDFGRWLLVLLGGAWLMTAGIGTYLAVPKGRSSARVWRSTLTPVIRGPKLRILFSCHRAAGLWTLPLVVVIAVTGTFLALPEAQKYALLGFFGDVSVPAHEQRHVADGVAPAFSMLDAEPLAAPIAGAYARTRGYEALTLVGVSYYPTHGVYIVNYRTPDDLIDLPGLGGLSVDIDAMTGNLVEVRTEQGNTGADAFMAWQYPLHSGLILGVPGQLLMLATGLAIAAAITMGGLLWWRRRRSSSA